MAAAKKPTKAQSPVKPRSTRRGKRVAPYKDQFHSIEPLTPKQMDAFREYEQGQNLVLSGFAGTGKTFTAMYLALKTVFDSNAPQDSIIIVRSAIPTQDIGFLPGTYEEKIAPYEEPYDSICDELFKINNVYDQLKLTGHITFAPVSFIRGVTFDNAIIIVDEFANCNGHQLDSIITRCGENTKIIFSGDITQSDLHKKNEKDGVANFVSILKDMEEFEIIEFGEQDIVRSDLVRNYIINKHRKGFEW